MKRNSPMMLRQLITLAFYVVQEALQTRFFILVLAMLLSSYGLVLFVGQVTLIETTITQTSISAGFLRLAAGYIISLFVISNMVREFHDKTIYLWLAAPVSRSTYLIGRFLGFAVVAGLVALACGVMLMGSANAFQVFLWTVSLSCELWLLCGLSLLCVLTFTHTVQAFSAVLGFYLLARSISGLQSMAQGTVIQPDTVSEHMIAGFMQLLAMLLPDLDQFTQTSWLVYEKGSLTDLGLVIGQSVIYIILLLAMSLFDLYRKNL